VVVDYFDLLRPGGARRPFETDAPLIVDPDAVEAGAITPQCFQPIAWQLRQIAEAGRGVQDVEPFSGLAFEGAEFALGHALRKGPRSLVTIAQNHPAKRISALRHA